MSVAKIGGIVAVVLGIGGAPAAAVEDLTGTYAGKLACKGIQGGVKGNAKLEVDLVLDDTGTGDVWFQLVPFGSGQAVLLTETAKPERGVLTGMTCSLIPADLTGHLLRLEVKTKAGSETATVKGTVVLSSELVASSNICQLTAKRTSTTTPVKLASCEDM